MISKYRPETEFLTPERCYIVEIYNRSDDESRSIARSRVKPGITTQLHALKEVKEQYIILEGEGLVEIGDAAPTPVQALDIITIPPGVSQRITNTGQLDLVFLCICIPRFTPEQYINLEEAMNENIRK